MKSAILGLLLISNFANNVLAAGAYDGVYQYGLSPAYYSVHQNGNQLILVALGSLSVTGNIPITIAGTYTVRPPTIEYWGYSMGTILGNTARISGVALFGACQSTVDVTFDNSGGAAVTLVSYVNTAFGSSQGVNCLSVMQSVASTTGTTISLRRIF